MSRTIKGSKPPGYDYWSRRPRKGVKPQGKNSPPGPYTKQLTHRSERRQGKAVSKITKDDTHDAQ